VVFVSDLGRALETAARAFEGHSVPSFTDWRLRECDYGELNGYPATEVHGVPLAHLDVPYPGGESYRDVVARVASFLGISLPAGTELACS
jgi:broad specificity phosphatase PhoE